MPIRYVQWIDRSMLKAEPETLFVFGDNLEREGLGGQAAAMRGEPNAVGLPTKRAPTMHNRSFLRDGDLPLVVTAIGPCLNRLMVQLVRGRVVVWPDAGIGTGLAQLKVKAPLVHGFYESLLAFLEKIP